MNFVLVPLSVGTPDRLKGQMHMVRRLYLAHLILRNLTPLFVSTLFSQKQINMLYTLSNGVLFMGGVDVDPRNYKQRKHAKTELVRHGLDKLEISLAQKAFNDGKPILGVCRGCQIINVSLGGTLHQHVPDTYGVDHSVETYDDLGKVKTTIHIFPHTNLFDIAGTKKETILCGHHQSVDKLGLGLRVCAQDKNGVVEAIEGIKPDQFALGVQAHIEMQDTLFATKIFDAFAEEVMSNS